MKHSNNGNGGRRRLAFEPTRPRSSEPAQPRSTYRGPPISEADLRNTLERLNIKVVDDETAEQADFVLCMPDGQAEYFSDDVHTLCYFCMQPIHHRPHVPKRPKKICIECAGRKTEEPN